MTNILLTRSLKDNQRMIDDLASSKFTFHQEPMIQYTDNLELVRPLATLISGRTVIITSMHGAELVASNLQDAKLKAYVVGEYSAQILINAGIEVIGSAENVTNLAKIIDPETDPIYLRGEHISQELTTKTKEYIIYSSSYRSRFSPETFALLRDDKIDVVTLFSNNVALAFIDSLKNANLDKQDHAFKCLCLSDKIANICRKNGLDALAPSKPNLDSFYGTLLSK